MPPPLTLDTVKARLRSMEIFDWQDPVLSVSEKEELEKLARTIEFVMTSRSRQPYNVQNTLATMRLVQKTLRQEMDEGHVSRGLASKFRWNKLSEGKSRRPRYVLNQEGVKMRIFYT